MQSKETLRLKKTYVDFLDLFLKNVLPDQSKLVYFSIVSQLLSMFAGNNYFICVCERSKKILKCIMSL